MEKTNRGFSSHFRAEADGAGRNISWSSIFAGVVSFLSLLILFSLIGSAIGLGVTDVTSNNPFDGVGTGLIIWAILSLLISLFVAGFVSGVTSALAGLVHGFLTWSTSVILLFALLTFTTVNTLQSVGSLLGTVGGAAGNGIGSVASTAQDAATKGFDSITKNVSQVDTKELEGNVDEILKDTDIKELQPGYLQNELDAVQEDVTAAGKEAITKPENFDTIVQDLGDSLTARAEKIEKSVDEDKIADAVAKNTDLTGAEAEEATQNIVDGLNTATKETTQQIENAKQTLDETSADLKKTVQDVREQTEQATQTASKVSIWAFVGLLLTLIFTSFAGIVGSRVATRGRVMNK
ncbi:hypothetical protein [Exiguobacterium sp. MH3]|uniref:hypothetical protein n=1 Tax=Exiguobacterium sp. MH3 TaxID=1399115 RepID=UPI0003C3BFF2|nr:hypothetical protein [Exiguobacterium sp. MH3]AHA29733.1 hypothetical protein U719_08335 [Exiguobacterium sp. MH3]